MAIKKAYNLNEQPHFEKPDNDRYDNNGVLIQPIIERDFTYDEERFGKINAAGNDIEVDTVRRDSFLNDEKKVKKEIIKQAMLDERVNSAKIIITIGGIAQTINAMERSLVDCKSLKNYMIRNNLNTAEYRDINNNSFQVTQTDLDTIKDAIEDNGLALYTKKWTLENQIDSCTTEQEINNINW